MLIVTSMDGKKTEPLNNIQGFEMNEEVNRAFTVQFTSFSVPNNPGHELLEEKPIISVDGYDFRLAQLKTNGIRKDVTAVSTFFDLIGHRQEEIYGGTRTLSEFASFVFKDTGWTFTSEVTGSRLIPNFGENNVVVLKEVICAAFECEMKILPDNHVHFAPKIGPDNDEQYRRGHNIKSLAENVGWSKMRTQITGYGANGLVVTYTSPNAAKYGIVKADPIHDDEITESSTMLERLKSELVDYPDAYFELDAVELSNKELGERVWLIDEVMGIEFQTRVLSKKTIQRANKLVTASVVLGTTLPKTNGDRLAAQKVEIDENRKEYRSRFEQTNELIHMSVEEVNGSIAALEIKADAIDLSVNNRITSEIASINVKADNISLSVNNRITNEMAAINVRADNINLAVSNLGTRVSGTEASINIQAGQIESKVSQNDFNGQTISSKITQDPYAISMMAQNLALQGLVTITNLKTPGATIVDGSNVYSNAFVVGRGTGSTLTMTAVAGSHQIQSIDAAGLGIISNGSMGLRASGYYGVYVPSSPLVAQQGFRVEGGVSQFNTDVTVNATLSASALRVGAQAVVTANMLNAYPTISEMNAALALKESQIVAWANGKFALK